MIDSLAVMPFANESEEPDSDYLSDGITETLIDRFSRLSGLRVLARNTTFQYKGKQFDPLQVGAELRVSAILTGSVSKRGERLVIKTELIDARDGTRLWSYEHNRPGTEILVAQQEIVRGVTRKLRLRVPDDENASIDKRYTENTDAYKAYLKGRYFLNRRSVEGLTKAVEYFEQALDIDPLYAPAYAGLSDTYALGGAAHLSAPEGMPLAKAAAKRALELDDQLAEAHTSLAFIAEYYDWDFEQAESEFRRAIELNPNYATARHWYGEFLAFMGRHDEAIREVELAQELDPLSLAIPVDLGVIYHYARRYDRAIEQFEKIASLTSNRAAAHGWLMLLHFENGMPEKAESEYRKAKDLSVTSPSELFNQSLEAHYHALSGNRGLAKKELEELKRDLQRRHDWEIAQVLAILDEKDESLALLEKIYEKRGGSLISLKVNRFFDNLRSDPRFVDLMRRVGFAQ